MNSNITSEGPRSAYQVNKRLNFKTNVIIMHCFTLINTDKTYQTRHYVDFYLSKQKPRYIKCNYYLFLIGVNWLNGNQKYYDATNEARVLYRIEPQLIVMFPCIFFIGPVYETVNLQYTLVFKIIANPHIC